MRREEDIQLLLEWQSEAARWRRFSAFLMALFLHAIVIALLLVSPQLLRRGEALLGIAVAPEKKPEATFLLLPPDLIQRLRKPPKTRFLSDQNRRAQGRSPLVYPNGIRMPYLRGNSKLPEIAGGAHPHPAPPSPPPGNPAPKSQAQAAAAPHPASPPAKSSGPLVAQLQLQDVNRNSGRAGIPITTPGEAIEASLQAAAQGRARGGIPGPGEGPDQLQNLHPNFSVAGPTILSDTRGVNFGPYLARVVYVVRQNWYAVIPESARLGEKGRVGIVFEILKDGSVPQIRLVASSGSQALDLAALASIRASNPFPPLPPEFTGHHLVLQFVYLYNLDTGGY